MEQRLETAFVAARLNSTEAHERQKLYYDSESCHRAYGVGELVWLNNPTENRTKLAPHWRGPYRVVQVLASGGEAALTYRIVNHLDPQERAQVVHHDRLKRYTLPMPPAVEPPTVFETSAPGSVVVSLPRVSEQVGTEGSDMEKDGESQLAQSRWGCSLRPPAHLRDFVTC
ncbi:uncharacterized protein V6R79_014176 [Siganus canaliculatus]